MPANIVPYCGATIRGDYRYQLWRRWDLNKQDVVWIMLNPSTADAMKDDPTIRRCIGFSKKLGYGGMMVVNLFAFRSTSPKNLKDEQQSIGPLNDDYILKAVTSKKCGRVICAWGNNGQSWGRGTNVIWKLITSDIKLYRLGPTTQDLEPRHPLYLKKDTRLMKHP